ncbi:MAG: AAA family ATPase [Planctomycetota bacterium]|nr:AAA family ATPase [Planctomycetota bacterium]
MLCSLELENFLLFERASFEFAPGLNAVSGETGAGKSLLARALALALGGRGGQDAIRTGCGHAAVRAVFGNPGGGDRILVERIIRREGPGSALLGGKPAALHAVRALLGPRVDFAAQNEQVRLADSAYQVELLDGFGGLAREKARYAGAYRAVESLAARLRAGREERELARLRGERLRADLALLDEIGFDAASDPRLEEEIRELSHAAAVVGAAGEAAALLDGEPSAASAVAEARRAAERMRGVSPRLAEAADLLEAAGEGIDAALRLLGAVGESADADPARLDAMIARSERLKGLARRFECAVAELGETRAGIGAKLDELADWDAGDEAVRKKLAEQLPRLAEAGLALRRKRLDAGARLSKTVDRELADLGMGKAGFLVAVEPLWDEGMPLEDLAENAGASGLDEVAFHFSPNPGEAAAPLARSASGGEASRAVLALKTALSRVHRPELMFLDEVDAGVGARLGTELGLKLTKLAESRQVVVITHLPQIAARARRHLLVRKAVRGGRTSAAVTELVGDERVKEVASMIHGSSAGRVTLEQAREMLREGGQETA